MNTHISNIVNWKGNRWVKNSSSHILMSWKRQKIEFNVAYHANNRKSAELPRLEHTTRTATNHLTPILMDYNTAFGIYIHTISLLSVIPSNSLLSSMSILSPSKQAFRYSRPSEIVPHIMQVNSSDFLFNYFIRNMTTKDWDNPINNRFWNIIHW